jgi:hypothetical protein
MVRSKRTAVICCAAAESKAGAASATTWLGGACKAVPIAFPDCRDCSWRAQQSSAAV